jgi:hypothetical protein
MCRSSACYGNVAKRGVARMNCLREAGSRRSLAHVLRTLTNLVSPSPNFPPSAGAVFPARSFRVVATHT